MPRTKKKVKSIVKTKVISARVTEVVYELLHQQAEDAGMTLSEFTAQMLMKGRVNTSYVFYVHPDEIEAITREFQRLFQELEQGMINCILVKDLSRFGRNYIEVGRYLERIFPVMRVRLIAVTDNYDSQSAWKTSDSIMVPMRNLLNDAYCRDISVKIKSQLAVKRKRGDFVGSFAKYSLQGTTQGRYLTGGVPPVRFSM